MGQRGALSGVARTAGGLLTGVALTLISLTTSADQMTSILISALATGYGSLRDEEDPYHKKKSGGEGAPDLPFHLITGNSVRGMAGVQPEARQGHGKAADLEMNGFPGILMTHVFEGAGKKGRKVCSVGSLHFPCPHFKDGFLFLGESLCRSSPTFCGLTFRRGSCVICGSLVPFFFQMFVLIQSHAVLEFPVLISAS